MNKISGPTPEQTRAIEKAYEDLQPLWYVDTKTKEIIRRPPITKIEKITHFFAREKNTVWQLQWWLKFLWHANQNHEVAFDFPIQHDGMITSKFPRKYELSGGWTIPKKSLKYLKNGPLFSEGTTTVLVNAKSSKAGEYWNQYGNIVRTLAATITVILFLLNYGNDIINYLSKLFY